MEPQDQGPSVLAARHCIVLPPPTSLKAASGFLAHPSIQAMVLLVTLWGASHNRSTGITIQDGAAQVNLSSKYIESGRPASCNPAPLLGTLRLPHTLSPPGCLRTCCASTPICAFTLPFKALPPAPGPHPQGTCTCALPFSAASELTAHILVPLDLSSS